MVIIGTLFFIFGFVTWLNGSLIPFLKVICDLDEFEALFVTFAFYIAYTVMALPMSYLLDRVGYKNAMALGLIVMALGSIIFIPAALTASFILFLMALFTMGTGLTILQSASNPYIVYIGDIKSAARRISIMGLINKGAGVIAPLMFSAFVLFNTGSLEDLSIESKNILALQLITPYIIMALILIFLAALVKFSSLEDLKFTQDDEIQHKSIFEFPRLILGAVALFFYVGIEVIAGDTIGLYGQSLGVQEYTSLTSFTMSFMVFGYLCGLLFIPKYLSQEKALFLSSLLGGLFLVGVAFSSTQSSTISSVLWGWSGVRTLPDSVTFVALLGFANALVWPTIWPLAIEGLGKHTAKGSAILIMAIAGGATLPLIFGKISQVSADMQTSYLYGIVCYIFIFLYALKWHKILSWKKQ
jgi:glucose/galactose transporter